ncbi:periplasmic solute binding family protein [Moraxella macacae 0408225]|uniref:Periplasmic solute binding family protein n=1 Tax=Moraxella macacae 0408225 TaxID=1230338 RepID=L2F5Y9_9GAMM|nr:zinc ABC transporter substrate-binding protein [Moraxella macacae]ELA08186.1 periplasmic solute binding family protein [Moraxella macacae 0408225]
MKPNQITNFGKIFGMTIGMSVGLVALTACQQAQNSATQADDKSTASTATTGDKINVYASTNVWGSVLKNVGGDHVNVIVAVNDVNQDPHEYQATAQDKLNISQAKLVLVNGGGYDDWATSLAKSVEQPPMIINAVDLSGLKPDDHDHDHKHDHEHDQDHSHDHSHGHHHHHHHGEFNEHVFFSLDTAKKVAEAAANHLSQVDTANKATYEQNAKDFIGQLNQLQAMAKNIGKDKPFSAFATEPVIGYLLNDMGIKDATPKDYIKQSETNAGVSVKVLDDSKKLLKNKQVSVLVVNAQTEDATSKQLVEIAKQAGLPTVSVNETFPVGIDNYVDFMKKTIDDFAGALNVAAAESHDDHDHDHKHDHEHDHNHDHDHDHDHSHSHSHDHNHHDHDHDDHKHAH